jgi:hypothetical protein
VLALIERDRHWLGIERLLWYNWRDSWDPFCTWCRSAGLLSRHVEPKPAFETFRTHAGG